MPRMPSPIPSAPIAPALRARGASLLLLAAACALAACAEPQLTLDQLQRYQDTEALGGQADTAGAWRPTSADPVTITLSVPAQVPRGVPVPVQVLLHNGSVRPVSVGLGQREDMEVVISRIDKPARQGAVFGPMQLRNQQRRARATVVTDPILPGRDSTFQVLWPQTDDLGHRVPPGRYKVRAVVNAQLLARQRMWTNWATVTVTP